MDSRRSSSVDEDAKIRQKHQVLLQEYLVLQKECVSKKRKLKEAKERKETLMDEIRFLKRRRSFLLNIESQEAERQHEVVHTQKPEVKYNGETSGRYFDANEPAFQKSRSPVGAMWKSGSVGKEEVGFPPLRLGKKPKNLFANGKRAEKRKISWQDPVALKQTMLSRSLYFKKTDHHTRREAATGYAEGLGPNDRL